MSFRICKIRHWVNWVLLCVLSVVSFSSAFYIDKITGLMRKTRGRKAVNYWVFVDIFGRTTWICLAASVVVLTLFFCLVTSIHQTYEDHSVGSPGHVMAQFCRVLLAMVQKEDEGLKVAIGVRKIVTFNIGTFLANKYVHPGTSLDHQHFWHPDLCHLRGRPDHKDDCSGVCDPSEIILRDC